MLIVLYTRNRFRKRFWYSGTDKLCIPADDLAKLSQLEGIFKVQLLNKPNQVAALPKGSVCGHSLAGIVVSNPAGGGDVCLLCVVLSDRWLCVGLITLPEEYHRVCCV